MIVALGKLSTQGGVVVHARMYQEVHDWQTVGTLQSDPAHQTIH